VFGVLLHGNKDNIIENDSKRDVFEKGVTIHLFIRVFTVKDILLPKERSLKIRFKAKLMNDNYSGRPHVQYFSVPGFLKSSIT
jgi:hypothetical protein